jgi:TetR/AcrR family transcriptional regulator, transcriptional repressor for nem operon
MKKSDVTRWSILEKAFELMYVKGYQSTSIDEIIAQVAVTKGAFFYHFKNKEEMGLAMIEELMSPAMRRAFVEPLQQSIDPVMDIYAAMKTLLFGIPTLRIEYGCPAANLVQEMSPVNAAFGQALSKLTNDWKTALATCIENGKETAIIRPEVDGVAVAYFVMSGYWGVRNFGKLYLDAACYTAYLKELKRYLRSLE